MEISALHLTVASAQFAAAQKKCLLKHLLNSEEAKQFCDYMT